MSNQQIEWVLNDTKETIIGRGKERDLNEGERTIPKCVVAFNSITGHNLSNEDGWLFMQVLKMCRSVQGSYKYDDYRDGIGYAALRAEEAIVADKKRKESATCVRPMTATECKEGFTTLIESCDRHSVLACYECGTVPPECDTRDDPRKSKAQAQLEQIKLDLRAAGVESVDDVVRDLKARGYGKPGQVIEVCKHERSNCYECGLQNEIDVRSWRPTA